MVDRSDRDTPVRGRIKTLAQAAMNADVTVGQVDEVLSGLSGTIEGLDTSMVALNRTLDHLDRTLASLDEVTTSLGGVVDRLEAIAERVEYMLGLKDLRGAVGSPLAMAESAVRGAVNTVFGWTRR
ncbi:ATPase [Mycobacterium koreense]|uniref:Uncharacterized protein n=1 Tax=Mycolicibacillus koreensis TaxID=1069220 RepID=A0A7I7SA72_9MYCO|nr:hypothetical protein [Mycolicibacillus koreensis]MCV7248945.1 ATPase [Mycolicibacillus koreensis]ODR09140.1 hypothetical protein BHQ15_07600 [Mycolicibacillus koreensis]OSC35960.1 hypothetical protein B8W67_00170 [Mycolicibacillus koreensis]BBY53792.1 hypothetical protein MKOR_10430 [Mycolicibacillus koreensis]